MTVIIKIRGYCISKGYYQAIRNQLYRTFIRHFIAISIHEHTLLFSCSYEFLSVTQNHNANFYNFFCLKVHFLV